MSTSIFMNKVFPIYRSLFSPYLPGFRSYLLTLNAFKNVSNCRQIQSKSRLKLERIHKKKQDTIARSREALKKLRKQKLEGLMISTVPKDVEMRGKLSKARSIRRLLYLYNRCKEGEALTLTNQVTTLSRLGQLYDKDKKEREVLKNNPFYRKLIDSIVESVSSSCGKLSLQELVDVVVALSLLRITDVHKYRPFIKEIEALEIKQLTSDNIGMLSLSFGLTKNGESTDLMREIGKELLRRPLVSFTDSSLSEIAWGFVKLSIPAETLIDQICIEILSRDVSMFKSRDIALISLAFSKIETSCGPVSNALQDSLYAIIENLKFPTRDIVALTVGLLRSNNIRIKMFRRLDTILVSRRDFQETVPKELLEELLHLLHESSFHLSETKKIIENVLHPESINSVFDVFFRPRISWKTKVFKQSWFKVY